MHSILVKLMSKNNEAGFNDLLKAAQAGDSSAMTELLKCIRSHVDRIASKFVDEHDPGSSVSDLVQESWLRAWDNLERFDGAEEDEESRRKFLAWVGQIVKNIGMQSRRDRGRQKRKPPGRRVSLKSGRGSTISRKGGVEPASKDPTPSEIFSAEEEALRVRKALSSICDSTVREVVFLRFFEGLNFREIAARLELTYDQVRERFHRGMGEIDDFF